MVPPGQQLPKHPVMANQGQFSGPSMGSGHPMLAPQSFSYPGHCRSVPASLSGSPKRDIFRRAGDARLPHQPIFSAPVSTNVSPSNLFGKVVRNECYPPEQAYASGPSATQSISPGSVPMTVAPSGHGHDGYGVELRSPPMMPNLHPNVHHSAPVHPSVKPPSLAVRHAQSAPAGHAIQSPQSVAVALAHQDISNLKRDISTLQNAHSDLKMKYAELMHEQDCTQARLEALENRRYTPSPPPREASLSPPHSQTSPETAGSPFKQDVLENLKECQDVPGIGDLVHLVETRYCVECKKEDRCILFAPCFHLLTCADCARDLTNCLVCEKEIQEKREVLFA